MNPPFEVSNEYKWTRSGPLVDYDNQQGWILICKTKLPPTKNCLCGCTGRDKYGATFFRDGESQVETDHKKKKFV